LKDLAGTGGRIDILARALPAAFLVSHGLRPEIELTTLHLGPPNPGKAVRVRSRGLMHLNPDERSSAALLEKALGTPTTGPVWQASTPGIAVARLGLADLLDGPVVVLAEDGIDIAEAELPADARVVLGDHLGFTPDEAALLAGRAVVRVSLGPVSLQADQCVTVLHNHLDRRGRRTV
jgi:tRNA (pseudouridine54-N1)-methyltransferase